MQENKIKFGQMRAIIRIIRLAMQGENKTRKPKAAVVKLTIPEVCARLKCSTSTLWRKRKQLKPIKKEGEHPYFLEADVDEFLTNSAKP